MKRLPVVLSGVALALAASATAGAQAPAPVLDTITAGGTVQQRVKAPKVKTQKSIAAAVRAAQAAALPAALERARLQATRIASLTGVTLGAVTSVTEQNYGFFSGPYCRVVRKPIIRRGEDGRRRVVGRGPRRKVCTVPPFVYESVSVTYRIVPAT